MSEAVLVAKKFPGIPEDQLATYVAERHPIPSLERKPKGKGPHPP